MATWLWRDPAAPPEPRQPDAVWTKPSDAKAVAAAMRRRTGLTYKALGVELGGVTPSYARDLAMKGEALIRRRLREETEGLLVPASSTGRN